MGGRGGPNATTWADIYALQRDGLVRLAYLITRSQATAEDVVQDVFIRVMAKIGPAGKGGGPGPYLRRSVINACYSWQKHARRERPSSYDRSPYEVTSPQPIAATETGDVEMWDALGRLPIRQRTILVLRFYLDLTEADTAAALGCRVGTVKSGTHRALAELQKAIER